MKKLVFLDIDGTLIDRFCKPSPLAEKAVRQARANGHLVFLCTGRNLPIISQDILQIGFDGIIASAGSYVQVGDQVLFDSLLPEELVQECLAVFHDHGVFCRLETPEGIYTDPQMEDLLRSATSDPANSELIRMQKEFESSLALQRYEDYPGRGAYKACFTSVDLDRVWAVREILGDRFEFVVHAFASSSTCFNGEIIPRGIDKGRGIEMVCRHLGLSLADTVAFGDSMNDAEMLRCAGVSVVMGNAGDDVKALADVVCEDVAHDGVYWEMKRMGLCG